MRKFFLDAADTFAVAAAAVIVVDADALVPAGSWEQAAAIGVSLGRAGLIAGIRAIAPLVLAARDRRV